MFIFILLSAPILGLLYTLSKLNYKKFDSFSSKPSDLLIPRLLTDETMNKSPKTLNLLEKYKTNALVTSDLNNVNIKNGALQTSILYL